MKKDPTKTEGISPKAVGGTVGAGLGWAVSQLLLDALPGKESSATATAVTIVVLAAVAFLGGYLPRPGVVTRDDGV